MKHVQENWFPFQRKLGWKRKKTACFKQLCETQLRLAATALGTPKSKRGVEQRSRQDWNQDRPVRTCIVWLVERNRSTPWFHECYLWPCSPTAGSDPEEKAVSGTRNEGCCWTTSSWPRLSLTLTRAQSTEQSRVADFEGLLTSWGGHPRTGCRLMLSESFKYQLKVFGFFQWQSRVVLSQHSCRDDPEGLDENTQKVSWKAWENSPDGGL